MKKFEPCPECGIPLFIGRELNWEDNGVISLVRSPANRMVLYESRVIDSLFRGIEELIGLPIEHIVIESRARETKRFIERQFPAWLRRTFHYLNRHNVRNSPLAVVARKPIFRIAKLMAIRSMEISELYGYGRYMLGELWKSGDRFPWRVNLIRNPYSLPFSAADALGTAEALEGQEQWVKYEKIGEDVYRVTSYPAPHPVELKERLRRKRYAFKPGDITYRRCASCGLPKELQRYRWDPEEGTITDEESGWRMAIFGPMALEAVLDDLQAELGEEVPRVVVEAERRFVKSRVGGMNWRRGGTTFNRLCALRGMGNITLFEADENHLSIKIENSCLPMLMVGMAQAIYETAMNLEKTSYEWEQKEDGDLYILVKR